MTPLISFIITYHNEPEAYLRACMESIEALPLAQDEAEVIVVDDGSRNRINHHNKLFKIVRQEESGLSVARNTGIAQAQGCYIQFIDADDYLVPSAYETVLEQLRKASADIILFQMTKHETNRLEARRSAKRPSLRPGGGGAMFDVQSFLMHHNLRAAAWGYAFKRDVLGDLRFCPGLLHEDELFTPQLFRRAKSLVDLNVKAYFYRQHDGTITHSKKPEQVKKRLDDILFIIKELRSLGDNRLERRIRQLTVDYLQKTWTQTHSLRELHSRVSELRKEGFLPLPLRCYSLRYLAASLVF